MIDTHMLARVLSVAVSFAGLWILTHWIFQEFFVDNFRQSIFAIRDRLFDDARDGLVAFDHPAYGLLRQTMNGYIRFAHKFSLGYVVALSLLSPGLGQLKPSFAQRYEAATADLSPETRARLNRYRARMEKELVEQVLFGSPLLLVTIVVPLVAWVALKYCMSPVISFFRSPINSVDSAAMAIGDDAALA